MSTRERLFPNSSVASPLLAATWLLVFLGAIRTSSGPLLPFGPVWTRYAQSIIPLLREEYAILTERCCFTPRVAAMLFEDWELRDSGPMQTQLADLDIDISVAAQMLGAPDPINEPERSARVETAVSMQLVELLDSMLVVECAAELEKLPFDPSAHGRMLAIGTQLAGDTSSAIGDSGPLLLAVAHRWKERRRSTDRPDDLSAWLEHRVELLLGDAPSKA